MKNSNRMSRINDEIKKEISEIILNELKDPRINAMTSVIKAEATQDLKFCKVYVSVLGDEEDKKNIMAGLKNAGGFIRHLLAERVNLRLTPQLIFKLDDSLEYSIRMSKLIDEISVKSDAPEGDDHDEKE